jgi:hypothetical protein
MTKKNDPPQSGEGTGRVTQQETKAGLDPIPETFERFLLSNLIIRGSSEFNYPNWDFSHLEAPGKPIEGLPSKIKRNQIARVLENMHDFLKKQQREPDELLFGGGPASRPALPPTPTKPVGEEALRERIAELEEKLAEAERVNSAQHSRLIEERRAATTANRINDQLQKRLDELEERLDRQFNIINERARANDAALAALAAKQQGRLLVYEALQGEVIEVSEAEVVVRFDTEDDIIEQTYEVDQFTLGKIPAVGDQLAVYVHVALVPPPAETVHESKSETHEPPYRRRNVITGDHRF